MEHVEEKQAQSGPRKLDFVRAKTIQEAIEETQRDLTNRFPDCDFFIKAVYPTAIITMETK